MTGAEPDDGSTFAFRGPLWHWRGPAPFYFVRVPSQECEDLAGLAAQVSYGWGMIPVVASVGPHTWETSLWPKDGGYLLPIRASVRLDLGLAGDDLVSVRFTVATRDGRLVAPEPGAGLGRPDPRGKGRTTRGSS